MSDEPLPIENSLSHAKPSAPAAELPEPDLHPSHHGLSPARSTLIAVAGWLIPGLGHAFLRMWGRAATILLTVAFLVYLGAGMRGNLFAPGGDDAFARLGFAADVGAGVFYFAGRALETSGADVSHADGDYGTRFLATAGVLNFLAALHAYEAARRRKA